MTRWKNRCEINGDVVRFTYIQSHRQHLASEVYVWDLDKTYLDTKFESLSGLYKAFFEKPSQKKNVPGTAELVRSLQDQYQSRFETEDFPIFFITASPPQMETNIVEKLNIDGIQPMGLYCKDNFKNLRPKRLWRLSKQVGYKLQALLQMRINLLPHVNQILWGDDSESDVIIYNIYSDICSRRMDHSQIEKTLKYFFVTGEQLKTIFSLQERIPIQDPVEKIYINLAEDTDAEYYLKFGRRVFPSFNTFQTALDLFQDNKISVGHVVNVAEDLTNEYSFTVEQLEKSLDEVIRRQSLSLETLQQVLPALIERKLVHCEWKPSVPAKPVTEKRGDRVISLDGIYEPWVPEHIDYFNIYR